MRPSTRINKKSVRDCVAFSPDTAWEPSSNKHQPERRGHCGYSSANIRTLITLPHRLILNVRPCCCVKLRSLGNKVYFEASRRPQPRQCLITDGVGRVEEGVSLTVATPAVRA